MTESLLNRVRVVLYEPQDLVNIAAGVRAMKNMGLTELHLVRPLGFDLDDKHLRRAGLDYHEYATLRVHDDLDAALADIAQASNAPPRLFALSTRGQLPYDAPAYRDGDAFLFGSETSGLPPEVWALIPDEQRLRLPMRPHNRSLNLSNAVAVMVFEAWRQTGFDGGS